MEFSTRVRTIVATVNDFFVKKVSLLAVLTNEK